MGSKPKASVGDLVIVKEYEDRVFQVEGYSISENYYYGGYWRDILYDLVDVSSGDLVLAFDEDVTRLATADKAEEYLEKQQNATQKSYTLSVDSPESDKTEVAVRTQSRTIDDFLDEYNDIKRIVFEFGDDVENNYNRKLIEIEQKIKKMSSEGGR